MATLTDLSNMPAANITAYTDSIKQIATILGTVFTVIGTAVGGLITHNSIVTKKNTDRSNEVKNSLDGVAVQADELKLEVQQLRDKVSFLQKVVESATTDLTKSIIEVKKVEVKIAAKATEHLSGITSVQKLMEHRMDTVETKADIDRENMKVILNGLEKLKK